MNDSEEKRAHRSRSRLDERQVKERAEFIARLESLIPERGETAFARKAGISAGGLRGVLKSGNPGREIIVAIARAAGVRVEWLATGEGEKWVEARETPVNSGLDGHQGAVVGDGSEAEEGGAGCDMMAFARAAEVVKRILAQEELSLTGEAMVDLLDLAMRIHDCPSNLDLMARLARHMTRKP